MKTTNFTHRQSIKQDAVYLSPIFLLGGKFKFMTKLFTYVIN